MSIRSRCCAVFAITAVGMTGLAAQESAEILRSGTFHEVTDGRIGENEFYVTSSRMSAAGNRIVYTTSLNGVNFVDRLRIVDTDGGNDRLIFQEAGPGLADRPKATFSYAISADGNTVAYTVWAEGPGCCAGEIHLYDAVAGSSAPLLTQLLHTSANSTSFRVPQILEAGYSDNFVLSGDGNWVFFLNAFGPIGSGNTEPVLEPDGETIYRVNTGTGVAEVVFSQRFLTAVPDLPPDTHNLGGSGGVFATNHTGSVLLFPAKFAAGAFSARALLRVDPAAGPASVASLLDLRGTSFRGPDLNAAGDRMAATWWGGELEEQGVFVSDLDGGNRVFVDGGGPSFSPGFTGIPALSADGSAVVYHIQAGGGSQMDIYWAPVDQRQPIPVGRRATLGTNRPLSITADGQKFKFLGSVRFDSRATAITPFANNAVVFAWDEAEEQSAGPVISEVVGDPSFEIVGIPALSPPPKFTTAWRFFVSGENLGDLWTLAYDADGKAPGGLLGLGPFGLRDDGEWDDEVAGDGRIDDVGIWCREDLLPGVYTGRGILTSEDRRAVLVEFPLTVRAPVPPVADFEAFPLSGPAPLAVSFTNTSSGDFNIERWDRDNSGGFNTPDSFNPVTFVYNTPGVYSVRLEVEFFGEKSELVKTGLITVTIPGGEGEGEGEGGGHSADQSGDGVIQLGELLRVVQFFNSGGLHCAEPPSSTEDGYVPGANPAQQACAPHSSDYAPQDWAINLTELLRTIQFFNSDGYHPCPDADPPSEDGFCPGPPGG